MCPWSQPEDEDTGLRIPETGNGTRPIRLILVGSTFDLPYAFAIAAKARTALTLDHRLLDAEKVLRKDLRSNARHCLS
jgi:hypothetical protein